MTARLFPTLPMRQGQSPTSYVSGLAAFHGVHSARALCSMFELSFQRVADGRPDALRRLAEIAGIDEGALSRDAPVRTDGEFLLRDQALVRSTLRRTRLYGCPDCLVRDMDDNPHLEAPVAMAGRTRWLLEPIRTCPDHGRPLVELGRAMSGHHLHDFSLLVGPGAASIRVLADAPGHRTVSALERHLLDRLDGEPAPSPWLEGFPWHAAAKICEMLGAVAAFGREVNLNTLDDADWHRAGSEGFAIAEGGEASIRAFLSDLHRTYPASSLGKEGPGATFGRLVDWLMPKRLHPAYEPVRDLVHRHVNETMPVGPRDELFGRPFSVRLVHSVRTAALETGAHPKRLRKILAAAGHLARDADRLDHHTLFAAAAVRKTLGLASETVSMVGAAAYLNAGRVGTKLLADAGFIKPFVPANDDPAGFGKHGFAKADLDDFLARLTRSAVTVEVAVPPRHDIPRAAKYALCGAMDIVSLILAGDLGWVGTRAGERGYLSVLVDGDEIRKRVQLPPVLGRTPGRVIKALGTTYHVVKALTANGILPVRRMVNPLSRAWGDIVLDEDLAKFKRDFVSVAQLAKEWEVHPFTLKRRLTESGLRPAFDPKLIKASFYVRADVDLLRSKIGATPYAGNPDP